MIRNKEAKGGIRSKVLSRRTCRLTCVLKNIRGSPPCAVLTIIGSFPSSSPTIDLKYYHEYAH
jgi:hypothetical protein